jgi:hypothetical protein
MAAKPLGTCCSMMAEVLKLPNSMFRIETNGVLYVSVANTQTPQGLGWFDQPPLFCPFCGAPIQDSETIRSKSSNRPG